MADSHKGSNPEMSVQQIFGGGSIGETTHHTGHQVADDDEITDADTEALDGNGSIENDSGVGVGDLAESKETGRATVEISGATRLKIEAKAGSEAGPDDDEAAEQDAHVVKGRGHSQDASADDGIDEVDDAADPAGLAVLAMFLAVSRAAGHGGCAVWAGRRRRVAVGRADRGVAGHDCS